MNDFELQNNVMQKHGNIGNQNARKESGEHKPRIKYRTVSIHPDDAARWESVAAQRGLSLAALIKLAMHRYL